MVRRKSSKYFVSGSDGRMRISWVILQRRLPRRSESADRVDEAAGGRCLLSRFPAGWSC